MDTPKSRKPAPPSNSTQRRELPEGFTRKPRKRLLTINRAILLFLAGGAIFALLIPSSGFLPPTASTSDRKVIANLVNAIVRYAADHGKFPTHASASEPGVVTNAPLMDALTGSDPIQNPRGIVYFEGKPALPRSGNKPERAGLIEVRSGSKHLLDRSGLFFELRFDHDGDGLITPPDSSTPVKASVICWSYGRPSDSDDPGSALKNAPDKWITSWR